MLSFHYLTLVLLVAVSGQKQHLAKRTKVASRIINGANAVADEFPHQATLLVDNYHSCGASVIANGWALTAAHCVVGWNLTQMAIVTNLIDFDNPVTYEWFDVAESIPHETYNQGDGATPNDIALLRLRLEGRDTTNNAIPVASGSNSFDGETCIITGWGYRADGSASSILQKADVSVLTSTECTLAWGSANILDQHLCVMGFDTPEGTGACNGDTGGPVTCGGVLSAVMSWGTAGCHTDGVVELPTVCARTSSFYDWISTSCEGCV